MNVYSFWCRPSYSEYGASFTVVASSISEVINLILNDGNVITNPDELKGLTPEYLYGCIEKGSIIKADDSEKPRIAEYFFT